MSEVLPSNGLSSTLSAPAQPTDAVISIQSSDAPNWPTTGSYRAVLWRDPNTGPWEVVTIVSGQGTANLGVQRAAETYNGGRTAFDWPVGTGIAAVITHDGLSQVIDQSGLIQTQTDDVVPTASSTQVVLSRPVQSVFMVARAGLIQSQAAGHYSISGSTLTFTAAFNGTERVVVSYTVDPSALAVATDDVVPASSATTVTLSHTPNSVFMVARNGLIQSAAAGHYSLAGNILTFAAAFSGSERVIASYSVRSGP